MITVFEIAQLESVERKFFVGAERRFRGDVDIVLFSRTNCGV